MDILQPSHVLHKNCQWVRSEDLSKTTGALMHSNMLHYNDNSHQQYESGRLTWKDGRRGVIKCLLYPTVNYLVKVTNLNASLRLTFPLILFLLSFLRCFSFRASPRLVILRTL